MASIDDIASLLSGQNAEFWSQIAVTAVLIYDAIITLDEEVKYFWKSPFSPINFIFFLMRYTAILSGIMNFIPHFHVVDGFSCLISYVSASLLDLIIILCMDYILFLRVRALSSSGFDKRRNCIILSMCIAYFSNALVALGSLVTYFVEAGVGPAIIADGIETCGFINDPIGLRCLYWSVFLVFESILLATALYKVTQIRRSLGFRGLRLLKTVVFDQAAYYTLVVVCGITNILTNTQSLDSSNLGVFVISNILGSAPLLTLQGVRMLIRLKKIAEKIDEATTIIGGTSDASVAEFRTYSVHRGGHSAEVAWSLGE